LQTAMASPENQAGRKAHTVLDPLEIFIEAPGQK
jgi:hypothetical protein